MSNGNSPNQSSFRPGMDNPRQPMGGNMGNDDFERDKFGKQFRGGHGCRREEHGVQSW